MKPEARQVLNMSAMQLLTDVLPQVPAGYVQGTTSLLPVLSMMVAQEYERGADIRAAENADMRALFVDLASMVEDVALGRKLKAAAGTGDQSLAISSLDTASYHLRRLLIELQRHVEDLPGADAR